MRSTSSVARPAKSKPPTAGLLTRTPSTSTRVCEELAPRMKTEVLPPGGPLRDTSTPGTVRSSSATVTARRASISARSMTVTALPTRRRGVSSACAETTISSLTVAAGSALVVVLRRGAVVRRPGGGRRRCERCGSLRKQRKSRRRGATGRGASRRSPFPPRGSVGGFRSTRPGLLALVRPTRRAFPSSRTVAVVRLSSRSQSRGGGGLTPPSLGPDALCGRDASRVPVGPVEGRPGAGARPARAAAAGARRRGAAGRRRRGAPSPGRTAGREA